MSSSLDRSKQFREFQLESTAHFAPSSDDADPIVEALQARIIRELAEQWREGSRPSVEHWLGQYPLVAAHPELAVRIIYEEICLREDLGEIVKSSELYARFPQWREPLEVLFHCHRLMQGDHQAARFPEAGESLGELQLLSELGRGGAGRVFLATQPALSDRPLVVKITHRSGQEHLSLARLQHTHVVPLYLVQDFPAENLRALCMPYLGGMSWARLLDAFKGRPPQARSGSQIVALLAADHDAASIGTGVTGPAIRFLNRATYVQAVCWIGSCLADALHYAQQRGLVHLDIKPSNVLLAADGQPMLLDFHLACQAMPAGEEPDHLGGTRGYMSPEQEQAAAAVREGTPIPLGLDGRSDIYSLGVLLFESLCGKSLSSRELPTQADWRRLNPEVSRGLQDIVNKCLAASATDRYRDAGELASDLRRHLADLPLSGVPNHSLKERWQKWRRRKPHALVVLGTVLSALAVICGVGLLFVGDRLREARSALLQGQADFERHEYASAIEQLEDGESAIRWILGQYDLKKSLHERLSLARRARLAQSLHELVERLRFIDDFAAVPVDQLSMLDAGCGKIWQARAQILPAEQTQTISEIDRTLRTDLLDLALLWAELRIRLAPESDVEQARRQASLLLQEAEALCGPSPVLELARQDYGQPTQPEAITGAVAAALVPRTPWEHFAVGRRLFRADKLEQAQAEFNAAIQLQSDAFWPNFYLALCAYRLEEFEQALNSASVCVALSPTSAECFYNRALSHQALGHFAQALEDLSRAKKLEPALSAAVYHQMALVHVARQDRDAALESVEQSLRHNSNYAPAEDLKARLTAQP